MAGVNGLEPEEYIPGKLENTVTDARLQCAEIDFDLNASMLGSQGWKEVPSRTRVYRQVRTDVFEFFTEVRSTVGVWNRIFPWKRRLCSAFPATSSAAETLGPAQNACVVVCNLAVVLGGYVSGVLGGMALMTLFQLNLFNINPPMGRSDLALHYYAPVALAVNRTYWGLICVAISSSISRTTWISIVLSMSRSGHQPHGVTLDRTRSAAWCSVAVVLYMIAFIANIAHSVLDSELEYVVERNHDFYSSPLPQKFLESIHTWKILNTVKSVALIIAWFAVVVEWQPRGLGQLNQDLDRQSREKVHEEHLNTDPPCSLNLKASAMGAQEAVHTQLNGTLANTRFHSNPAFDNSFMKSVPIYPSAGAGIT